MPTRPTKNQSDGAKATKNAPARSTKAAEEETKEPVIGQKRQASINAEALRVSCGISLTPVI
jgi:hypothetical protein